MGEGELSRLKKRIIFANAPRTDDTRKRNIDRCAIVTGLEPAINIILTSAGSLFP